MFKWLFSLLFDLFIEKQKAPKQNSQPTNRKGFVLVLLLTSSLTANAWFLYKVIDISHSHVLALRRMKELEANAKERNECPTRLNEAHTLLRQCLVPGRR